MKKTLICNGCSFMAGDEIAWDQFCKENNKGVYDFRTAMVKDPSIIYSYLEYRANYNLPMSVAKLLGTNRIDVSSDGNSNDMIAINTINYILSIPKEERKNYHVLIGWSTSTRRMKFFAKNSCFVNLNIHHLSDPPPELEIFKNYITSIILEADNEDHYINYIKNIMLLENFLIANDITYTFYRALGTEHDCTARSHVFQPTWTGSFRDKEISNSKCWIKFNPDNGYPHIGASWTQEWLNDPSDFVSTKNLHPNLKAMEHFAKIVAASIEAQGDL
jgi:hypothetical protein